MKEKQDHEIDVLIEQYFAGKLNAEGLARLKEWALESEENRIYMRRQVEIWFSPEYQEIRLLLTSKKLLIYLSKEFFQ